jgi:hypothetical protein
MLELIAERLKGLDLSKQLAGILPGSTPQNPNYTIVLNQKDIWAFMPKDAFFRSGGPGTRRDDGARGVGVGG